MEITPECDAEVHWEYRISFWALQQLLLVVILSRCKPLFSLFIPPAQAFVAHMVLNKASCKSCI